MKSVLIVFMLCTSFLFCVAQNSDSIIYKVKTVEVVLEAKGPTLETFEFWEQKKKDTTSNDYLFPILIVEDYDLSSPNVGQTLVINDSAQFQFEGSVLFTGELLIWLQSSLALYENERWKRGVISGFVKNGRKEGEWILEHTKGEALVVIKKMNYKHGLLHGDYFVYTSEGAIIPYQQSAEGETAATSTFENGTGWYVDFYNLPPYQLKVRGRLVNGQKEGRWNVYDKNGDIIVSYIYQNGIIVNL